MKLAVTVLVITCFGILIIIGIAYAIRRVYEHFHKDDADKSIHDWLKSNHE
jgi:hypothetical protein